MAREPRAQAERWTYPEYRELIDRIDDFTGKNEDPSKRTLGDTFGMAEPETEEEKAELERAAAERRERRKVLISDYDLGRILRFKWSTLWGFRKMVLPDDRLEDWQPPHNMLAETVGELTFPALTDKKLDNRIERFKAAAERVSTFADLIEEELEDEEE
jgi:hypothetical protein